MLHNIVEIASISTSSVPTAATQAAATAMENIILIIIALVIMLIYLSKRQNKLMEKERRIMQETNWEQVNMLLNEIERRYGQDTIKNLFKKEEKNNNSN